METFLKSGTQGIMNCSELFKRRGRGEKKEKMLEGYIFFLQEPCDYDILYSKLILIRETKYGMFKSTSSLRV